MADGHRAGSDGVKVLVLGDRVAVVVPSGHILMFDADEAVGFAGLLDEAAGLAVLATRIIE